MGSEGEQEQGAKEAGDRSGNSSSLSIEDHGAHGDHPCELVAARAQVCRVAELVELADIRRGLLLVVPVLLLETFLRRSVYDLRHGERESKGEGGRSRSGGKT